VQTASIGYTDGDNSITIADGGKATFAAGFAVGSDAAGDVLYHNGTSYVRLAKGDDDEVLTLASGVPSWVAAGGGGAWERIGGSDGESSGSGDVVADLVDVGSLSIAVGTLVKIYFAYRKAAVAGTYAVQIGLKLNSTQVIANTTVTANSTSAHEGFAEITFIYGRSNYLGGARMSAIDDAGTQFNVLGTTNMPTATLNNIIVTGGPHSGVSSSSVFVTDVHVFQGAGA
jgi:hypothetical protein